MTHVEDELNSQPECWSRAAAQAPSHAPVLPAAGERVAVVGCGTSYFLAQAVAALRVGAGRGETDAFAAARVMAPEGSRLWKWSRWRATVEIVRVHALRPRVADLPLPGPVNASHVSLK